MAIQLQETCKSTTLYTFFDWDGGWELAELEAALRRQELSLKDASRFEVLQALMQGRLESTHVKKAAQGQNKIQDGWLLEIIGAWLVDELPVGADGIVKRAAVGTNYTQSSPTDGQLFRETFRNAIATKKQFGNHHQFIMHLDWDDANGADTVIADGSWTSTAFEVDDTTGINPGDAARIQLGSQFEYNTVASIDDDLITLTAPLSAIPQPGAQFLVCIGEVGLFGSADADDTPNSGTCFSRARLRYPKISERAPLVLCDLILVGV